MYFDLFPEIVKKLSNKFYFSALQILVPLDTSITLQRNSIVKGIVSGLPSSKSVSNRALVLNALAGGRSQLNNLSEARDTRLMEQLIASSEKEINVMDAGTTMRFLTAYFAITNQNKILNGTPRMQERPIAPLVDALKTLGADIRYLGKEGYPPIEILGFSGQKSSFVKVPGNLSSQFISALMMVGPMLPDGLTLELQGHIGSRPYIEMTKSLLEHFGATCTFVKNVVTIAPGGLKPREFTVEPDWSATSYWFGFCALAAESELTLKGDFTHSTQGDQVMREIGPRLGVKSEMVQGGLKLSKIAHHPTLEWNFTDCPDLAQTVLPICAVKGIQGKFTGLESLRIKETDRIAALQAELGKLGTLLTEPSQGQWLLTPCKLPFADSYQFNTYHDHRMAMGLAPLATHFNIAFDDKTVVNKSYPRFWDDVASVGFSISGHEA